MWLVPARCTGHHKHLSDTLLLQGVAYNPAAKPSWSEEALPGLAFPCPVPLPGTAPTHPPRVLTTEACAVRSRTHTGPWTQVLEGPQSQGAPCLAPLATLMPGHQLGAAGFGDRAAGIWPCPAQRPRGPPWPTATVVTKSEASVSTAPSLLATVFLADRGRTGRWLILAPKWPFAYFSFTAPSAESPLCRGRQASTKQACVHPPPGSGLWFSHLQNGRNIFHENLSDFCRDEVDGGLKPCEEEGGIWLSTPQARASR